MIVAWAGPVPLLKEWFLTGKDVHTNVAQMIARVVQHAKIPMPKGPHGLPLFSAKHWSKYDKSDSERSIAKQTVHANNYGMGKRRYAMLTGLPERYADTLQKIYLEELFPEVRNNYQRWIDNELRRCRTLITPQGRRRIFYDQFGPDLSRAAYAFYPQSTVGDLCVETLCDVCEIFEDVKLVFKSPLFIRRCGLDVRLQIHDAIGVSIPNNQESIEFACKTIKTCGEKTLVIKGEPLVIPLDFKVGRSWGEAKDYEYV